MAKFLQRLSRCRSGAVAVISAIALPLLLGVGSLGIEVGHWYLTQRQMQGAADAAAVSAAAQYIADFTSNPNSTTYQTVGQNYAATNGFAIPAANVCLLKPDHTDNCGPIRTLDSRSIVCSAPPCLVVEITQDTLTWLTTQHSMRPTNTVGQVHGIATPVLKARSIVSLSINSTTISTGGTDCVLALANSAIAVQVRGTPARLRARCGIAIDGGIDQNPGTPALGDISFSGGAIAQINNLVVASAHTANSTCPDGGAHCQQYCPTPGCTAPPLTAINYSTATPDPYAAQVAALFQTAPPQGARGATISAAGNGYTNGQHIFTVSGGARIVVTVSGNKVTAIVGIFDPGAYTTLPAGALDGTVDNGAGSGAKFTLTNPGCFTWPGTAVGTKPWIPIAGRKYCSIFASGQQAPNFAPGTYWIAGGDGNCVGFCLNGNNASMTSDAAGVTFMLTNGEGTGTFGTGSFATISIASGTVSLCAPGTGCGTGCSTGGGCMLFVQNPAATISSAPSTPAATTNAFAGNGHRTLSGLLYLPKQTVALNGNGPIDGCFGVIAKFLDVGGTPEFSNGCLPGNGIGGGTTTTTLVSNPRLSQ